jgi:hypothetical protein
MILRILLELEETLLTLDERRDQREDNGRKDPRNIEEISFSQNKYTRRDVVGDRSERSRGL